MYNRKLKLKRLREKRGRCFAYVVGFTRTSGTRHCNCSTFLLFTTMSILSKMSDLLNNGKFEQQANELWVLTKNVETILIQDLKQRRNTETILYSSFFVLNELNTIANIKNVKDKYIKRLFEEIHIQNRFRDDNELYLLGMNRLTDAQALEIKNNKTKSRNEYLQDQLKYWEANKEAKRYHQFKKDIVGFVNKRLELHSLELNTYINNRQHGVLPFLSAFVIYECCFASENQIQECEDLEKVIHLANLIPDILGSVEIDIQNIFLN